MEGRAVSDRWAEARDEAEELTRSVDIDEHAHVTVIPYTPVSSEIPYSVLDSELERLVPGRTSCPILLWCNGHPTGASVTVRRDKRPPNDGWDIVPRRRGGAVPITCVAAEDVPYAPNVPARLEVVCGTCGAQWWRDPSVLIDGIVPALREREQRAKARGVADGNWGTARVQWARLRPKR